MADYPDLYADGVTIGVSAYGLAITFLLSDPSAEPGMEAAPNHPVVRIRLSAPLAEFIGKGLLEALSKTPQANQSSISSGSIS